MAHEIVRPTRWPSVLLHLVVRAMVVALLMIVSAEWSQAVVNRRDRVIERTMYRPVPSMCENHRGFWQQCPWVGAGPYVSEDDVISWRLDSRCVQP